MTLPIHPISLMRLHMFLQLVIAMEVLPTTWVLASVLAHLAVSSAMLGKVRGLGESLAADIAFQRLVFCVDSFVDSWKFLVWWYLKRKEGGGGTYCMRFAVGSIYHSTCTSMASLRYEVACAASLLVPRRRTAHKRHIDNIYLQAVSIDQI